jgi:hypothetical protein
LIVPEHAHPAVVSETHRSETCRNDIKPKFGPCLGFSGPEERLLQTSQTPGSLILLNTQ